jgi:WD40 repeat protein
VATGKVRATLKSPGDRVRALKFTPDDQFLASADRDGTIKLWEMPAGKDRATLPLQARERNLEVALAIRVDGKALAAGAGDGTIKMWDIVTGKELVAIAGHEGCVAVAFTDGGKTLASASRDGTVKLWDVTTGKERVTFKLGHAGRPLVFSPDNKTLALGSERGPITLWDVAELLARKQAKEAASQAEPAAEADRGRHPGFPSFNVLAGGPGSFAERSAAR